MAMKSAKRRVTRATAQLSKGRYLELVATLAALTPKDFRDVVLAVRLERELRVPTAMGLRTRRP